VTRGAVDLKIVRERLELVRRAVEELRALPSSTLAAFLADRRNAPAAESHLRRGVEALFDTVRHLLSKAFGLGQLEYREAARAAGERGLIADQALAQTFVKIAGYRNRLTHHYEAITPEELFEILRRHLGDLQAIASQLRSAAGRLSPGNIDDESSPS
jgi:uncharacterized protein YutE (UPF0331/DUF86 family)